MMVPGSPSHDAWTYARSGVDVEARSGALSALLERVRYRAPPAHGRPVGLLGHFAGLVRVGRETIAITTDTVGTKVLLASRVGRWEEVGEDIVAVNVNDLAAVGARTIGLVDVISCAHPDPSVFSAIGRGLDRGLREAECSLLGGETAIVPDLVSGIDLGGTAIGFFPRGRRPITGESVRPGDVIVGIPSTGLHANGFTLVRQLIDERRPDLSIPRPGGDKPLAEELLTPTRIYSRLIDAVSDRREIHGLANITGGGVRNLVRLSGRVRFHLDAWPEPTGIFAWLRDLGSLDLSEMYQTFNMGIGFALVIAPTQLSRLLRRLARAGAPDSLVIGRVQRGRGVVVPRLGLEYDSYR